MPAGTREVHLAGEEQRRRGAHLRDQLDRAALHRGGRVEAVHRAVVQNVEGEEEGEQDHREERGGHLRSRYANHQDAIRRIALGRPHGRAGHPPGDTRSCTDRYYRTLWSFHCLFFNPFRHTNSMKFKFNARSVGGRSFTLIVRTTKCFISLGIARLQNGRKIESLSAMSAFYKASISIFVPFLTTCLGRSKRIVGSVSRLILTITSYNINIYNYFMGLTVLPKDASLALLFVCLLALGQRNESSKISVYFSESTHI